MYVHPVPSLSQHPLILNWLQEKLKVKLQNFNEEIVHTQKDSIIKFMIVFRHGHDDAEIKELIKELIMLEYYIEASPASLLLAVGEPGF